MATGINKTIYVTNIDERITKTDITKLFGLDGTPFLAKNCKVEIITKEGVRCGLIVVPEEFLQTLLKLDGVKMYEKVIRVSETFVNADKNPTQTEEEEEQGEIISMELDCRIAEWVKNQVEAVEVVDALLIKHPADNTKAVKKMHGQLIGVFRIQSTDFQPYINSTLTIRGKDLPLKPIRRQPRRNNSNNNTYSVKKNRNYDPDGVKVTIYDSYDLRFRSIPNEAFDNYFHELGVELIRQTQPQAYRNRRGVLDTHRFLVVKNVDENGNKIDLGTHVMVENSRFKIVYYGQVTYCRLCDENHGKACPSKARFELLQEWRKDDLRKRKLYSDSTLRISNQVALTSNISCMSGGGIGQICNQIPFDDKHENVVINAGTNEIKADSPQEFVYTVEKAQEKLKNLATTTNVTLVLPDYPSTGPLEQAKSEYLRENLTAIEEIKTITLSDIEWDDHPQHRHPTEKGTFDIIQQIHKQVGDDLILESCERDVVCPLKYRKVQTVYKVGCRGCEDLQYVSTLCGRCKESAKTADTTRLDVLIEKWKLIMYPPIEQVDIAMKEVTKRGISDDDDESGNISAKSARSSSD